MKDKTAYITITCGNPKPSTIDKNVSNSSILVNQLNKDDKDAA